MTTKTLLLLGLACVMSAAAPDGAAASGVYKQLICADPATGKSTGSAAGVTAATNNWGFTSWPTRCASGGGALEAGPLNTASVHGGTRVAIEYAIGAPSLVLEQATVYRAVRVSPEVAADVRFAHHAGRVITTSGPTPTEEEVVVPGSTRTLGNPASPLDPANAIVMPLAGNAFSISARCVAEWCDHRPGDWWYRVFAISATIRDTAAPTVDRVGGGVAAGDPTPGDLDVELADAGSGVRQLRVLVDGVTAKTVDFTDVLDECKDLNAANDVPEYRVAQPCPTRVEQQIAWDTTSVEEGPHRLQVLVKDAAGNETSVVDRIATFDNVPNPAPRAGVPPTVGGAAISGGVLTAAPGGWTGADAHEYVWQRCGDGGCTTLPAAGATYVATDADVGSRLRVRVTATNRMGEAATAFSSMSAAVVAAPERRLIAAAPTLPAVVPASPLVVPRAAAPTPNGANATRTARLSLTTARARVTYGDRPVVRGRLTDAKGRPIAGAAVVLHQQHASPGAELTDAGSATTKADGTFAAAAPSGPSRTVIASYRAFSMDDRAAATAAVRFSVVARLSLKARPARVGQSTMLNGRLVDLPKPGVQIQMQARDGAKWRTFDMTTTRRGGTFRYGYRFKRAAAGRAFLMRVLVDSPIYPFARAASRPVLIKVPG